MFFMILIFVYGVVFMQYFNSVPVYLKNKLAWSEDYIGMTMALNGFLIVLIEMPFIQLLEKREIFKLMAFGAILSGLSFIILLFGNWIFLIWLATIVFTLGEVISFPFVTTLVINRSSDELRGRYMAMYGMTFSLCHIVAPAFGMFLADNFGFNTLWIVLGILMLLTSVGFMFLKKLMARD
jgi:MFS family permease